MVSLGIDWVRRGKYCQFEFEPAEAQMSSAETQLRALYIARVENAKDKWSEFGLVEAQALLAETWSKDLCIAWVEVEGIVKEKRFEFELG